MSSALVYSKHAGRLAAERRLKEMLASGILKPSDKATVECRLGLWCVVRKP